MPLGAVRGVAVVFALAWLAGGALGPSPGGAEQRVVVFEREPWYRSRAEAEAAWSGTLQRRAVVEGPNARTALRYSLVTGGGTIAVYAPTDRLEPFVDGTVLVRGKLVDLSREGFGTELWPGSIVRAAR
jgi:hypothetical protein